MKTLLSKILSHSYRPSVLQCYSLTVLKSYRLKVLKSFSLLLTLSPLLLLSLSASAQYYDVSYPGKGYPVMLRYYDGEQFQRYVVPDINEQPVVRVQDGDKFFDFDLSFIKKEGQVSMPNVNEQILEYYEPGIPLEGDFPIDIKFTKDGNMFAVAYEHSDNVIFYSAATYEILANVQVVRQPVSLTMCDEHVYVCCHLGQGVVAISLDDFSISEYIAVDGTPFQVGISPGEDTAYIACDSFLDGWMIAYDMNTNQVIYETHDPYFHHYGWWTGGLGRTKYYFTSCEFSQNGDQYVCADTATKRPTIFNAATGQIETRIASGGYRGACYSPTGDTLYIYSARNDSIKMYRLNTTDNSILDSIKVLADYWITPDYSDVAISHDGSKAVVNNSMDDILYLFDFNTGACQFIQQSMLYNDAPIISSNNGDYAVCATMTRVKLIDFETGTVFSTTSVNTGLPLCVSPKSEMLIAGNLPEYMWSSNTQETLYSINFKFIDNITVDTAIICGESPEADVPVCAELSSDGTRIFSANRLTENFSVINIAENNTDTLIDVFKMNGIKVIPGTNYAIIYGDDSGKTYIVSQTDYSILKELVTNMVSEVFVTSDAQTAYLAGYYVSGNTRITKIKIDGASSAILDYADVGCTKVGYSGGDYHMNTTVAMSPDEQMILTGYDNPQSGPVVNIVSTETLELITAVNVPEYMVFDFAFSDDSKRAVAVSGMNQVPIIYLDGQNSYLENVVLLSSGSFSADYNSLDGMFYILEWAGLVDQVDPETGQIVESFPTYMDDNLRIEIDKRGLPMVLTQTSMIYDRQSYAMPGASAHLVYNEVYDLFLSAVPGPEWICVFDPKMVGIQQFKPGKDQDISIFPNPASEQIFIRSASEITWVKVCNMAGGEVFLKDFNERNIKLPTSGLKPGVYIVEVMTGNGKRTGKVVVK